MEEHKIKLGKTDIEIIPFGTGAWAWGDRRMWAFGTAYAEADVRAAFDASVSAGIDFFDTAEIYGSGLSERLLGQFVRDSRRSVVIATKFAPLPWRWRRKSVLEALGRSLDRLGVTRVDLYQLHWPFAPVPIEIWMEGMADAVEAGLTRAVGISNCNPALTRRAHAALAKRGLHLASNQVEYSLLQRKHERSGLIRTCRELGVTVIAYSPIAKGILSGKYTPENRPSGPRSRLYNPAYLRRVQPLLELLRNIGAAHDGKTPAQVSLNWLLCKGAVPIPGAKNARQLQENAGALGWRLSDAEVEACDKASEGL
jgi:aryl-alcohol dehydrogenase-like predicted oxidoreductase